MASDAKERTSPRKDRRRRPLSVGYGTVSFGAVLFATAWFVPMIPLDRDELTVTFTRGTGVLEYPDGSVTELVEGVVVGPRERVVIPAGGAVSFSAADGHKLTLTDSSSVNVSGSRGSIIGGRVHTRIEVEQGEVRISGEGHPRSSLDVGLPNGVAGVRGTIFELRAADDRGSVSVHEGSVELSDTPEGSVDLSPGDGAVLTSEGTVLRRVPPPPVIQPLPPGDSIVRSPGTLLRWAPVVGAASYVAEVTSDSAFLQVRSRVATDSAFVEIPILDVEGPVFVRVQGVTEEGLTGFPSAPYPVAIAYNWATGRQLREEGQVQQSLGEFQLALELRPENADLLRDLGWSLYLLGRHPEARTVYEQAREIAPENNEIVVELARVHFWLRDYDEAETLCRTVLDRSASHAHALWGLGDLYRVLGRRAEALDLVQRALRADPEHPYAGETLRRLRAGG